MRIKELRQERELTQAQVAKAIDTSQRNVSRWENEENEPTSEFIISLAKFFDVTTDYLLGLEDEFGTKQTSSTAAPPTFSKEERQLIEDYRSLTPQLQKMITNTIKTFTTSDEVKKHNEKTDYQIKK